MPTFQSPSAWESRLLQVYETDATAQAYSEWWSVSEAEVGALRQVDTRAPILDVGCGAGRIARYLGHPEGYLGIDQSDAMISIARHRDPKVEWLNADFLEAALPNSHFAAVLLMHNILDGFHPAQRRTAVLRKACSLVAPGGRLVFASHTPSKAQSPAIVDVAELPGDYVRENYHEHEILQYRSTPLQIVQELLDIEWTVTECHFDWSRTPFDWAYYVAVRE